MRRSRNGGVSLPWLADLWRDAAYAVRALSRSPGFTAAAVVTLSVGIGATAAIYSVVNAILLQPLPFADADRLVRVMENMPPFRPGGPAWQQGLRYTEFLEWRARTATLADTVAVSGSRLMLQTSEGTARFWGVTASAHTFTLLGTRAVLGRTLDAGDEANPNVVVISFDTWRRLFHSAPGVVGTTVESRGNEERDGRRLTIVGVLPAGFEFPAGQTDFVMPLVPADVVEPYGRVTLIGRLKPGVSLGAAMDEASVIGDAICPPPLANAPSLTGARFEVRTLKDLIVKDLRPALRVLLAAVAVVLLIVCANVANLLLARGTARQREMAVRLAIGAGRGRIVRQILTECLVLSVAGGVLGGLLAAASVTLVKRLATIEAPGIFRLSLGSSILPRGHEVGVDLTMLGIVASIAALTSLVVGVLPALHLSRTNYLHVMGPRGGVAGRGASRVRATLVVGQLMMATILLVGAGLLARSFVRLSAVDRGYDPANVLAFQLVFPADYSVARKTDTIETLLARLRSTPGIAAAGFTRAGMLIGEQITLGTFVPHGRTFAEMDANPVGPSLRPVSAGYLTAVGARLLEGRELAADAGAATPAIVISRSVARLFGPGSQVGRFIDWHMGPRLAVPLQIVGVVEDLRNTSPDREPYPEVFIDYRWLLALQRQWGESALWQNERALGLLSFAIRTQGSAAAAIPAVSRIVRAVDANTGIDAILPLDQLVASSVARQRFYAVMLGVFAAVAGFLAAVGVYAVLAYAVTQRTQEIGIRMALGAQRAQVLALVLRRGLMLTTLGVALGVVGAIAGTRFLRGMLFGITPLDPTTFVAVALMFGLVAALASYVPARRATKVDPLVALRTE